MPALKAVTDFTKSTDAAFLQFAENVHSAMGHNADFPTPLPSLETLHQDIAAFREAMTDNANRSQITASNKNIKRERLETDLKQLAFYVSNNAFGNRDKILRSGFTPSKEKERAGELATPTGARFKYGAVSGTVHVICDRVPNANAYEVQWKTGTAVYANSLVSPRANVKVTDLGVAIRHDFRIRAVGAAGPSGWAEVSNVVVI